MCSASSPGAIRKSSCRGISVAPAPRRPAPRAGPELLPIRCEEQCSQRTSSNNINGTRRFARATAEPAKNLHLLSDKPLSPRNSHPARTCSQRFVSVSSPAVCPATGCCTLSLSLLLSETTPPFPEVKGDPKRIIFVWLPQTEAVWSPQKRQALDFGAPGAGSLSDRSERESNDPWQTEHQPNEEEYDRHSVKMLFPFDITDRYGIHRKRAAAGIEDSR